jgi:hypothetical protein
MEDIQNGNNGGQEGQINFCEIEMQLLSKWTYNLAINVVPENLQCILMRLDREGKRYRIITGLPSDNRRHGIGEVGHLYEPVPKTALLEAVQTNEVVVIQQAKTDPRVSYMEKHVLNKDIEAIAIVPICYEKAVRWLIVIDKVPPSKPGFSDQELEYLKKKKHWLEKVELPFVRLETTMNYGFTTLRGILDNYGHEIRSRILPIGGYAQLIKKHLSPDNVKIKRFVEHIINESRRCENELAAFTKLIIHLYSTEDAKELIPVTALLDYFSDIPHRRFLVDAREYQGIAIASSKNALDAVFSELARYIATTGCKQDETWFTVAQDNYTISLVIKNRVFQGYKKDLDVRLSLFEHIIKKTGGNVAYGQGECLIRFPRD